MFTWYFARICIINYCSWEQNQTPSPINFFSPTMRSNLSIARKLAKDKDLLRATDLQAIRRLRDYPYKGDASSLIRHVADRSSRRQTKNKGLSRTMSNKLTTVSCRGVRLIRRHADILPSVFIIEQWTGTAVNSSSVLRTRRTSWAITMCLL